MTVLEKSREALDLTRLKLPPYPKVLSITAEDYQDWDGMQSLKVQVLIDEATELSQVTGRMASDLDWAIRQSLRDHGVQEFAIIRIAKPSELSDVDDEVED